jgi:hypothetical protein
LTSTAPTIFKNGFEECVRDEPVCMVSFSPSHVCSVAKAQSEHVRALFTSQKVAQTDAKPAQQEKAPKKAVYTVKVPSFVLP